MALSKHFKRSNLAQKFFESHAWVKKCHFWQFFREGFDGRALLGRPSKIQGPSWQSVYFKLPLMDRNVQVRLCLKVSVYSWDWGIWVSSTSYQKSNIFCPQQPPTEKETDIRGNLYFWWFIPQKRTGIGHFHVIDDQTIWIRKFFEEIGLLKPVRLQSLLRAMRLQKFLRPWKLLLRTFESSWILNSFNLRAKIIIFSCFEKKNFWQNHENPFWILAHFLSEAVEASLCYFFKNWLVKLKFPNLRNIQIPSNKI